MSKKIIVYGNPDCPDCVRLKELFDKEGIVYGYVDILAGLGHLKRFLKVRDGNACFESYIQNNKIGIPAVVVDGEVYAEVKVDGIDLSLFK